MSYASAKTARIGNPSSVESLAVAQRMARSQGSPEEGAPFAAISRWLFDEALPFWAAHGVDRVHGGFAEDLHLDGSNRGSEFKRTRVQARQIYVYAHAHVLGVSGAAELAEHGYRFMVSKAWQGDRGGWARKLTLDGRVLDPTPDLYDNAFVLLALGWLYRATGQREVLDKCHATAEFIDAHLRHSSGLGYANTLPAHGPRLQNPHMHLLEGALSAFAATSHERYLKTADEIITLFCDRLFDERTGTLPEHFDDQLLPLGRRGDGTIEPGHQFEWAWLLSSYQQITGRDLRAYARALVGFAERYGVDQRTGAVRAAVRNDGVSTDRSERVWPAAERLQAAVAMFELDGQSPMAVFAQSGNRLLRHHLAVTPAGAWMDQLSEDGAPKSNRIPASTLYHLMVSFTEVLRIKDAALKAAAK